jgi:hypothetical protein
MVSSENIGSSINGQELKIKNIVSSNSFEVEVPNLSEYSEYEGSGVVSHVNVPVTVEFKSMQNYLS